MISYIKGRITIKGDTYVVIENNGIGYRVYVPSASQAYIVSPDQEITLYTEMAVREDDISLYGFTDMEALRTFRILTGVSGVGAKAALSILSALTASEVKKAIVFNDPTMLTRAQGVGKKIAQRIALELKDKFDVAEIGGGDDEALAEVISGQTSSGPVNEAVEALVSLGYSKSEALEAVASSGVKEGTAEEIIKASLRKLSIL